MTREQAEKEADKLNEEANMQLCPVYAAYCLGNCVCRNNARATQVSGKWSVASPECTNHSICGDESIQLA